MTTTLFHRHISLEALKAPIFIVLLVDMIAMTIEEPVIGMVNVIDPRLFVIVAMESKDDTMMTRNLKLGATNVRGQHPLTIVIREVDMSTAREGQERPVFFLACHSFHSVTCRSGNLSDKSSVLCYVAGSDWDNGRWEWEDTPRRDYRDDRPGSRRFPSRSPMLGAASPDARLVSPWLGGNTPRSAGKES
jgi:hypothetical protein